ncbi:HEAT repeat domain-containing protein [Trichocoleus sp. FACHB-591]|uniref:peptidoglycan-binding protein n=1 Tax=Trichocoleus sp. FACHB-591 TaxID=2692872 RepID=UPI001686E3B6|nr:peptidoglycan-binding protein [Trichocoleus sp. FACHB-591]MBD2096276.1 HEAT repeat domain-containing protein [Trichocoleus sp. FACHB-591]
MTLYRSTLLLLTCVTFLGVIPEPARSYTGVRSRASAPEAPSPLLLASSLNLAQSPPIEGASASASTTASSSPSSITPGTTLQPGAQGPAVKQLQTTLKLLGYFDGAADGTYSPSTETAVLNFQKAIGLSPDGVAGPSTLSRLQELQSAKTEAPKPTPTPAQEAKSAGPQRSWLGWLVGVIAIAAIGTGILYSLLRASGQSKQPKTLASRNSSTPSLPGADTNPVEPSVSNPHTPAVEVSSNGHSVPAIAVDGKQSEAFSETSNSESLPVRETTRLAKINIVDELVKDLRSPDPAKRRKAIWELGQRGDTQAVQPLVDLMIDSDSKQRSLILASLSEIGVRTLKPMNRALAISLQDENPEVRKNAIRDITRIYDLVGQISQLLRHATEDPDTEVQETARWALNQVNRIKTIANVENVPALKNSVSPPESLPESLSDP